VHSLLSKRPLRGAVSRRRLALLDRHSAFTARLTGVRRGSQPVTPMARTLRRLRRWTQRAWRPVQRATYLSWHGTTVHSMRTVVAAPMPRALLLHRLTERASTDRFSAIVLLPLLERMRPPSRASTRVERILRVERQVIYPRLALPLARSAPSVQPPERVRAATAVDDVAAPVTSPPRLAPSVNARPQAIALAPQELSRVTDHVIRALDQRVLSYRERTGRI
jgi:hypothetical protein